MANVSPTVQVSAPTNVQASRTIPSASNASSQSESPSVEAISPQIAITPRDSTSNFDGFGGNSDRGQERPQILSNPGSLDAPTETFVAITQAQEEQSRVGAPPVLSNLGGLTGKLVEKAVAIYENNVNLFSGEQAERGSTLRITL
jgi:hypothetical protein